MIRKINKTDYKEFVAMATEFYHSDAVEHAIPESHITATFQELMATSPYAICYIFEVNSKTAGYALLAKTFSQEAGGFVVWIEELYIREAYRNHGLGKSFFAMLQDTYGETTTRFRLEVEDNNEKAIALYEKMGFKRLGYSQMYKGK